MHMYCYCSFPNNIDSYVKKITFHRGARIGTQCYLLIKIPRNEEMHVHCLPGFRGNNILRRSSFEKVRLKK